MECRCEVGFDGEGKVIEPDVSFRVGGAPCVGEGFVGLGGFEVGDCEGAVEGF